MNHPRLILPNFEDPVKVEPVIDDASFCDDFFIPDDAQFAEEFVPCIQEKSPGNHDESVKIQEDASRRSLRPRQARKIENDNSESDEDGDDSHSDESGDFENNSEEEDDQEDDESSHETGESQRIQTSRTKAIRMEVKHREYNSTSRRPPNYTRTDIDNKINLQKCQYCNFSSKNGYALDAHILNVHQGGYII